MKNGASTPNGKKGICIFANSGPPDEFELKSRTSFFNAITSVQSQYFTFYLNNIF